MSQSHRTGLQKIRIIQKENQQHTSNSGLSNISYSRCPQQNQIKCQTTIHRYFSILSLKVHGPYQKILIPNKQKLQSKDMRIIGNYLMKNGSKDQQRISLRVAFRHSIPLGCLLIFSHRMFASQIHSIKYY